MTSRDDIGRANLFRGRSHLEKFRDAVSSLSLSFSLVFIYRQQIIVFIFTTINWFDCIIYTHRRLKNEKNRTFDRIFRSEKSISATRVFLINRNIRYKIMKRVSCCIIRN